MAKFDGNILSLSENIAKSFRGWGATHTIAYMAFQYHVGPFHLHEAIPRSGGLGWFSPAVSDFQTQCINFSYLLTLVDCLVAVFTNVRHRVIYRSVAIYEYQNCIQQGRLYPQRPCCVPPKTAGWVPQFLIIMIFLSFDNHFETKVLFLMYFGSQIINAYYNDTNNGRIAE